MNEVLAEVSWPVSRLGEAIEALARRSRLEVRATGTPLTGPVPQNGEALERWIQAEAEWLGLEAETVEAPYAEVDQLVTTAGPALLHLRDGLGDARPGQSSAQFLALLRPRRPGGRVVSLLTPALSVVHLAPETVCQALCRDVEAPALGDIERILIEVGIGGRRRRRARRALLRERLATTRLGGCWILRSPGGARLVDQAREAGLPGPLFALLAAHACEYLLWILSWWLLGWLTLTGRLDFGWLQAWLLLLLMLIPFRLLSTAAGGLLSIRAGALLKRRLLYGALKLEPEEVRHLGVGQLLGRVIESETVELMAITGGFLGLTALVELILAGVVLAAGPAGWLHVLLLLGAVVVTCLIGLRYSRRRRRWTEGRLDLTNTLVEKMVGHRTRLAQEPRERWYEGDDQGLERYVGESANLDRTAASLQVLAPRLWFIAGMLALAPAFVAGNRALAALAVGVGGVILAYQAFRHLVEGLERLAAAAIAWERIRPFWHAAGRRVPVGQPEFARVREALVSEGVRELESERVRELERRSVEATGHESVPELPPSDAATPTRSHAPTLLEGCDLVFRYRERGEPVLHGVSLTIRAGDRLLLEGPSGGGKSTLAALLAGRRVPESGLLLLNGLDRETLGADAWRRRVVIAPQFHENHVLMGTFAFNALMGRSWPPSQADVDEAERVCRALDLGPLLDRMPAGLLQMVGETGWQLSHGEKSRLYIARAILQGADIIILDESFAALDPQTLRHTLSFVLQKAPTLLVIAHP